jgi:hypothetical protein
MDADRLAKNRPTLTKNTVVIDLIRQIENANTSVVQLMKEMKQIKLPYDRTLASTFLNRITDLHQLVSSLYTQSTTIQQSHILHTSSLHQLSQVRIDLNRSKAYLQLCRIEVPYLITPNPPPLATLFVSSSPFPSPVKQHVSVSPIHVQLLTSVHSSIPPTTTDLVTAELAQGSPTFTSRKGNNNVLMRGNQTPVENGVALFDKLIFNMGTNCRPVQLKFKLSLNIGNLGKLPVESSPCDPTIVITNTKQWEEAQGILLKKDIFSGQAEIPTAQFCNSIQMYFMKAIRQDPLKIRRVLSLEDFDFFFTSKLGKPFQTQETVTSKDFDRFWEWFGPILQKMHHHKIYVQLWTTGLLWGFISIAEAQRVLAYREPGTFILRWVDTCDGRLMISYKADQYEVKHYNIDTKELSGQNCIARIIRDKSVLSRFLQVHVSGEFERTMSVIDKFQGLQNITAGRFRKLYEDSYNDEKPGTIL